MSRRPACTSTTSGSCSRGPSPSGRQGQHRDRDRARPRGSSRRRTGSSTSGPRAVPARGTIVGEGTPEQIVETPNSYNGQVPRRHARLSFPLHARGPTVCASDLAGAVRVASARRSAPARLVEHGCGQGPPAHRSAPRQVGRARVRSGAFQRAGVHPPGWSSTGAVGGPSSAPECTRRVGRARVRSGGLQRAGVHPPGWSSMGAVRGLQRAGVHPSVDRLGALEAEVPTGAHPPS